MAHRAVTGLAFAFLLATASVSAAEGYVEHRSGRIYLMAVNGCWGDAGLMMALFDLAAEPDNDLALGCWKYEGRKIKVYTRTAPRQPIEYDLDDEKIDFAPRGQRIPDGPNPPSSQAGAAWLAFKGLRSRALPEHAVLQPSLRHAPDQLFAVEALMLNAIQVSLPDFRDAMRVFRGRRRLGTSGLLTFESGFVAIESGEITATMLGEGEWHGRARFGPSVLKALAEVPPATDPVIIACDGGVLSLGTMKVPCQWEPGSANFIRRLEQPELLDLLAMDRALPRAELRGTGLAKRIRQAKSETERKLVVAASALAELDITAEQLARLVEERLQTRLKKLTGG